MDVIKCGEVLWGNTDGILHNTNDTKVNYGIICNTENQSLFDIVCGNCVTI